MKIAIASPPFPKSVSDGLYWLDKLTKEASAQQAEIICFPESFIPGYQLTEYEVAPCSAEILRSALNSACKIAAENNIAIILPTDWYENDGFFIAAHVISN